MRSPYLCQHQLEIYIMYTLRGSNCLLTYLFFSLHLLTFVLVTTATLNKGKHYDPFVMVTTIFRFILGASLYRNQVWPYVISFFGRLPFPIMQIVFKLKIEIIIDYSII